MGPLGSFKNPPQASVSACSMEALAICLSQCKDQAGTEDRVLWETYIALVREGHRGKVASAGRMCPHTSPAGTLLCWPSAKSLRLLRVWSSSVIPVRPILSEILPVESQTCRTDAQCPPTTTPTTGNSPWSSTWTITVSDVETTAVQGFP